MSSSPEDLYWVKIVGLTPELTEDDIAAHFQSARCGSGLVRTLVYLGQHKTAAMIGIEGMDANGVSKSITAGHPTVLMHDEEKEIVATCQAMQDLGFGLTREMVAHVVSDYLRSIRRPNPFRKGVPGPDWWALFLKRWPQLSDRKPEHLSKKRAEGVTRAMVDGWLDTVKKAFTKHNLLQYGSDELAKRLWNADETGLCLDATSKTVLARRGTKSVYEVGGGCGREYITVQGCGSADGVKLPPLVVYKAKNMWVKWTKGGPAGATYTISDSGWMEKANFCQWFKHSFLPSVSHLLTTGPVVLFLDGHGSHIDFELVHTALKHGVILMCLPPHASHVLQPLDVTCYGPLKQEWRQTLKNFKVKSGAMHVTKVEFPALLKEVWENSLLVGHLQNGFKCCGLRPLSKRAVSDSKLTPALSCQADLQPSTPRPRPRLSIEVMCECSRGKPHLTPVRLHLRDHFAILLAEKHPRLKSDDKRKVKPTVYGQVMTSDEVIELLMGERDPRSQRKKKKSDTTVKGKGKASRTAKKPMAASKRKPVDTVEVSESEDDGVCSECKNSVDDEHWVACDQCNLWYHLSCTDLHESPGPDDAWICSVCSDI